MVLQRFHAFPAFHEGEDIRPGIGGGRAFLAVFRQIVGDAALFCPHGRDVGFRDPDEFRRGGFVFQNGFGNDKNHGFFPLF